MTPPEAITFRAVPISEGNTFTGCVAVAVLTTGQLWDADVIAITADGEGIPVHVGRIDPWIPRNVLDPVEVEKFKGRASYLLTGIMPEDISRIACFIQIDGEARHNQRQEEEHESRLRARSE